jgi:excinuclease ABC subunit C
MSKLIENRLQQLPATPGVYFHKDKQGRVIYVGKAAVLKNRVRQYFQKSRSRDPKTEALVKDIADVDWIETETELDALFLESELIKRYKPRYNIELRDDKSQLFVRINLRSTYPHVSYTRRPLDDGATYLGPYYNGGALKRALKYLRRIYPYSTHTTLPSRACLLHHLGLCPGVEEGKISEADYKHNLKKLIQYLKGQRIQLIAAAERDMKRAAQSQDFETAATLRNQLIALKTLRQQVVFGDREFMDISKDQGLSGLQELLDLKGIPKRIEGYDISHMSGTDTVASMAVFTNGLPDKAQYRKFKMRVPGNDDFAHMREVIERRFSGRHLDWPPPDLLLIDGGKGQVSAVGSILRAKQIPIPFVGLAKRQETIIIPSALGGPSSQTEFQTVQLDKSSHVVKLLQRIRDESHRFAVSYHSTLKTSRSSSSILEEIPTIGPATRKKLLRAFGSVKGVRQARQWELEQLIGPKKATLLSQYLKRKQ